MFIEITGAGFANKGAQLMLATVCRELRQRIPNVELCIPMSNDAYRDRAGYGLYFTSRLPDKVVAPGRFARDLISGIVGTTRLQNSFGLVPERRLGGIIDISGYAFGDKWPAANARRLGRPAALLKRRGKPVIMLPQMLGPFTRPGQGEAFAELARHVDHIYARDQESFECAEPLIVRPDQLSLAPDITITMPAATVATPDRPYVCIVANSKLLDPNPHERAWGDNSYLDRLTAVGQHALQRDLDVVVVQHEYQTRDQQLAGRLHQQIGADRASVFRHTDPQVLKGLLGGAQLVVGSRFHSLVSTLSMGVPAIALGWAHKYDALMRDFGTPEAVHRADNPAEHLLHLVDSFLRRRDEVAETIAIRKVVMAEQLRRMWDDVIMVLGRDSEAMLEPETHISEFSG